MSSNKKLLLIVGVFLVFLTWSFVKPFDYFTWFLETAPAILGLFFILYLKKRGYHISNLVYVCFILHAVILMIGGHYTYAKVPLFDWIRDTFGLARNHYDRIGHLAQGFFPAIFAREILKRNKVVPSDRWLSFFLVCIVLALSASYEFIEWWVSLATGTAADAFLGTQGDVWDTQWDMFLAFVGSLLAITFMRKIHDASIAKSNT